MKIFELPFYCTCCKTHQSKVQKEQGSFFCCGCDGILLMKVESYEEIIATREFRPSAKFSWCPVATIAGLRNAIKEKKLKTEV